MQGGRGERVLLERKRAWVERSVVGSPTQHNTNENRQACRLSTGVLVVPTPRNTEENCTEPQNSGTRSFWEIEANRRGGASYGE